MKPARPGLEADAAPRRSGRGARRELRELDEPIERFRTWLKEAEASEINDANAACLATADADGMPSARMVLLKTAESAGFVFYTNLESRKGRELLVNPRAAMCVYWETLRRQVRIEGTVEPVNDDEADAYFATRERKSQIGAWASEQSRTLEGRFELETRVAKYAAKYAIGHVPRPPFWSGFRLKPARIEFWEWRTFRLHKRLVYVRLSEAGREGWATHRLFP